MSTVTIRIPVDNNFYESAVNSDVETYEYDIPIKDVIDEASTDDVLDEIDTEDILEYLDSSDMYEELVTRRFKFPHDNEIEKVTVPSLLDNIKEELLNEASALYSLEELQFLLQWKQGHALKKINLRRFV